MVAPINFLAGDLGGTKTLISLYSWDGDLLQKHKKKYLSKAWFSLEDILKDFLSSVPSDIDQPTHGCMAVAGLVKNQRAKITNLTWSLEEDKLCAETGLKKLELINDFQVLIYGIPFLKPEQQCQLQLGIKNTPSPGSIAILGAGTGLGMAKGITTTQGIVSLPSEGGHCEFSPRSQDEWELATWLKQELHLDRLSIERIVSGKGLGNIASWLLQLPESNNHPLRKLSNNWLHPKEELSSLNELPELASQAAENGDPLMQKALELWLSAYGSAAGDFALNELCSGGLWIGGGTAAKQLHGLQSTTFLDAFRNKGRFKAFLQTVPVIALIDPEAGLFSAACRARMIA